MNSMLAALAAFACVVATPQAGGGLVAQVRAALHVGALAPAREIVLGGKAKIYGTDAAYTLRFRPDGRLVQSFQGPLSETYGSDGAVLWKLNRDGVARIASFEDVDEILGETLLLTDRWADPGLAGALTSDGRTLRLKLPDSLDERITVDPTTHLPETATFSLSAGPVSVKLSNWQAVAGREYPFHAEVRLTNEVRIYDVHQGAVSNSERDTVYRIPQRKALDVSFDRTKPAELEVRRASTGHLLVKPLVNGRDVGWFILDSGAESMCVDPKVADELRLAKVGTLPITGVGGTVTGTFRPVHAFTLGPATMHDVYFIELDLKEISDYFKVRIAGIVGDEYFDRCIVDLNVEKPAISVLDPASFRLPQAASWSPLRFESGNPLVEAKADGKLTGWYRLDTGDPNTVTFHAPYVKREHLLDGRDTNGAASGGIGGAVMAREGKIKQFELGGHRFDNLDATFSLADQGAFADMYVAGNIGQALMRPFNVVFDYGNSRIAFAPK